MRVFFTPVGTSDPARDGFEGPMLHILRHFVKAGSPITHIVLYLTETMWERESASQRYTKAVQDQSLLLDAPIPNIRLQRAISTDPSDFNGFIQDYREQFRRIAEEWPNAELVVNISSGTPQMIATACLLVSSSFMGMEYRSLQVTNPNRSTGEKSGYLSTSDNVDVSELLDNLTEAEDRCVEPDINVFRRTLLHEQLIAALNSFDVTGALALIDGAPQHFPHIVMRWIRHLYARACYDTRASKTALLPEDTVGFDPWPVKNGAVKPLYEFYFTLLIKSQRNELADYLMRLSPLMTELVLYHLRFNLRYNLDAISTNDPDGLKINRQRTQQADPALVSFLDAKFRPAFSDGYFSLSNLQYLVEYVMQKSQNQDSDGLLNIIETIRNVERKCRNATAHRMIHVTPEWIQRESITSIPQMNKLIGTLMMLILGHHLGKGWNELPQTLATHIKELLDKEC